MTAGVCVVRVRVQTVRTSHRPARTVRQQCQWHAAAGTASPPTTGTTRGTWFGTGAAGKTEAASEVLGVPSVTSDAEAGPGTGCNRGTSGRKTSRGTAATAAATAVDLGQTVATLAETRETTGEVAEKPAEDTAELLAAKTGQTTAKPSETRGFPSGRRESNNRPRLRFRLPTPTLAAETLESATTVFIWKGRRSSPRPR